MGNLSLDQAIQMATAIGRPFTKASPKVLSHDPLEGYDEKEVVGVVGINHVKGIKKAYEDSILSEHKKILTENPSSNETLDRIVENNLFFTSTRGKNKGFVGIAIRHMPSKYDEQDTCFILYNSSTSQEAFVNKKSTKLVAPIRGGVSMLNAHIEFGSRCSLVRGQQVYSGGKKGVIVATAKKRNGSPLYSVGVQWQNEVIEEWTFPHLLSTEEGS